MEKPSLPWMERQVSTYLHPKYHKLFIADCHSNLAGKSETCAKILKMFYDQLPELQRRNLERLYDEMSEEQKKNPRKV